jgi:TPR repeat protein
VEKLKNAFGHFPKNFIVTRTPQKKQKTREAFAMAKRPANTIANGSAMRGDFEIRDRDRDRGGTPFTGTPTPPASLRPEGPSDEVPTEEIILLLGQIGQRLQKSEQERQAFKKTMQTYQTTIASLEGRDEQREKMFRSLQDQLAERESAEDSLRRRQEELEAQQTAQMARIEKAAELSDRIEEALAQQASLNRRLDKVAQDKVRFVRKLERIEETVIETRTALQGRAVQALPGAAELQVAIPVRASDFQPAHVLTQPALPKAPNPAKRRNMAKIGILAGVGILVGLGIAGFGAYDTQRFLPAADTTSSAQPAIAFGPALAPPTVTAAPPLSPPLLPQPLLPQPLLPTSSAKQPFGPPAPPSSAATMTDRQLNDAFDKNPDALAAKLNQIEPGTPEPVTAPVTPAASVPSGPALSAPLEPKQTSAAAPNTVSDNGFDPAAFLKSQALPGVLAGRIKPDPSLPPAARTLEAQALKGDPEAQHDLAALYTAGRDSVKTDDVKAAAWFRESALEGIANAQYNLGVLYQQGLGVPKDDALAMEWYKMAALQNHPDANYNLGIAHIEGTAASYDPVLAARYFREAAKGGVMEASYNLGLIYDNGLLGDRQPDEAIYWYRTAGDQGSPEGKAAMVKLGRELRLPPTEIDKIYNVTRLAELAAGNGIPVHDTPLADNAAPAPVAASGQGADLDRAAPLAVSKAKPVVPTPNQAITAQVQDQLMHLGLYPGPADGKESQQTDDAIRSYQRLTSLPQNGKPTQALLLNMLSNQLNADAGVEDREASTLKASDKTAPGGT